jgi:hypothetical protein
MLGLRKGPESLSGQESLIADERLIKTIRGKINELISGKGNNNLDHEYWNFMEGHPSTLTDGEPLTPQNVGKNVLEYALQRFAYLHLSDSERESQTMGGLTDVFAGDYYSMEIILTNNHQLFLGNQADIKSPERRRRWMLVSDEEDNEGRIVRKVYVQIRNENPDGSDMLEMMTFLGVLHLVRKASFEDVNTFFKNKKRKPSFLNNSSEFEKWKEKEISVDVDFKLKRKSAIDLLVEDLEKKAGEYNFSENPPVLLIGNDFFLRLLVFALGLSKNDEEQLRQCFSSEIENLRKIFKERNVSLDLRAIIEKYYLLSRLNLYYREENEGLRRNLAEIYTRVFSSQNYEALGFRRLFDGVRNTDGVSKSPLAEPVDLWDPSQIANHLLSDETDPLQGLIRNLREKHIRILSVPYLIGNLSEELTRKLLEKGFINRRVMGFVGKVGMAHISELSDIKVGDQVAIEGIYNISGGQIDPNKLSEILVSLAGQQIFDIPVRNVPFLTVPALLAQTAESIKRILDLRKEDNNNLLALEMEMDYLVKFLERVQEIRLATAFYVSDKTLIHKLPSEVETNSSEKITVPISKEVGAIAVVLAILRALEQIQAFYFLN